MSLLLICNHEKLLNLDPLILVGITYITLLCVCVCARTCVQMYNPMCVCVCVHVCDAKEVLY